MAMADLVHRYAAPRRASVGRRRLGRFSRLALAVLAAAALGAPAGADPAGADPADAAVPDPAGKYYVVGQPMNGQREYLYDIARKTLGNGNRYAEIVRLNQGRQQADGAALTDSMEIHPGWVLLLPADARGPGVLASPPADPAPSGLPAGRSSIDASSIDGSSTGGSSAGVAAGGGVDTRMAIDGGMLRIGGFAVTILLLALAVRVLRGRRPALAATGPWPPEPVPPKPLPPQVEPPKVEPSQVEPPEVEPSQAAPPEVEPSQAAPAEAVPSEPELAERVPDDPAPDGPEPRPPASASRPAAAAPGPRPPLPDDPDAAELCTELDTDAGPVTVRLLGIAAGRGAPAFTWLADGEPAPPVTLPLVLGSRSGWRLLVDLARTPDVVTIVGPERDCRRQAAGLARQLRAAGLGVAVVDGTLDETVPGSRPLDRFPDLPAAGAERPEPHVVFCAGPPGPAARHLATVTQGHAVPIIVGATPAGRWSIRPGGRS
ncbi:hypothetical protein [Plantactinospora sp. KBS50]|uniref:hypothetical protein n=1 Tax=Plantactinospora sp. KBS50 TaxID=2024580 RepID=UPI0012FD0225|nr:hypothetical protein [Plantactinospora sp. KBS50]